MIDSNGKIVNRLGIDKIPIVNLNAMQLSHCTPDMNVIVALQNKINEIIDSINRSNDD